MSDDEDYLSDKFLVESVASSSQPKTYAQRRQEALKQSRIKNEQNQPKGRRQREQESREEGLRRSLFDRAQEDGEGGKNKALGIMLRMGFEVGQSLGRKGDLAAAAAAADPRSSTGDEDSEPPAERSDTDPTHIAEPLPLNEWTGRRGIGLGKRTRSPDARDRLAKMAKMAEDASREHFRDFARREFEERRAESRLTAARRTCMNLDETAGVTFNVLWIDPNDDGSVPNGLMAAMLEHTDGVSPLPSGKRDEATRLRDQMRADALQPVAGAEDDHAACDRGGANKATQQQDFPVATVEEAACFLRLGPRDRLGLVLTYLRERYAYCFWCGTKYEDGDDLEKHCPGPGEDDHD